MRWFEPPWSYLLLVLAQLIVNVCLLIIIRRLLRRVVNLEIVIRMTVRRVLDLETAIEKLLLERTGR
jgi:hypothetical protein